MHSFAQTVALADVLTNSRVEHCSGSLFVIPHSIPIWTYDAPLIPVAGHSLRWSVLIDYLLDDLDAFNTVHDTALHAPLPFPVIRLTDYSVAILLRPVFGIPVPDCWNDIPTACCTGLMVDIVLPTLPHTTCSMPYNCPHTHTTPHTHATRFPLPRTVQIPFPRGLFVVRDLHHHLLPTMVDSLPTLATAYSFFRQQPRSCNTVATLLAY